MIIEANPLIFVQGQKYDKNDDHDHGLNFIHNNLESVKASMDSEGKPTLILKDGSTDSNVISDYFGATNNVCYVVIKGVYDITYSFDRNTATQEQLDDIKKIKDFIDSRDESEVYDYEEFKNSLIVHIKDPTYNKNVWIDVDKGWISNHIKINTIIGKKTRAFEIYKVNVKTNKTYNFKFCILEPSTTIVLNTPTNKVVRSLNLPKHKSFNVNGNIYNVSTRIEVENTLQITNDNYSEDLIVVVGEEC